MEENVSKEILIENTKELAKEAYSDLAKPILKSLGSIISLPFRAIDAALTPIKKWIDKKNFNYEKTRDLLADKLKDVDESKIVEPESYVAVPALQQLSYSYDSEELRQMYANLLASAMIEDTKWSVHPSFVEIIKQLSPIDAQAMKTLYTPNYLSLISIVLKEKDVETYHDIINHYSLELDKIYHNHNIQSASLVNLQRLGLINLCYDKTIKPHDRYKDYKTCALYKQLEKENNKKDEIIIKEGLIELTDFGISFCKTCCND